MKRRKKCSILRIPRSLYDSMYRDLHRPHPFAMERVGFFSTNTLKIGSEFTLIIVTAYHSVPDDQYINDPHVGAKISSSTIREAMQRILSTGHGCLHVHLHGFDPSPSYTDLNSLPEVAKAFHNANPETASGYAIFSRVSFFCEISIGNKYTPFRVDQMNVVGYPMGFAFNHKRIKRDFSEIYNRQSFLGENAQYLFSSICVGVIGLGGGGSYIIQQLAHLGIGRFYIFDGDHIDVTNHNRLIGGWFCDIARKLQKTAIAKRLIKKINPQAEVKIFNCKWQEKPDELKVCDIVVGCVDSYDERSQLEGISRRSLIPYVDIGMDVHKPISSEYSISGQVILSMPGGPCMQCMQFITEDKLSVEAKKYGNIGGRPQVVWPNGVLASTAVGVVVDLITGWSQLKDKDFYLTYDGEYGHVSDHPRLSYIPTECLHYNLNNTGDVIFKTI